MKEKVKQPTQKATKRGTGDRRPVPLGINPRELVASTLNEVEVQLGESVARLKATANDVWLTLRDAMKRPPAPTTGKRIDLPTAKAIADVMIQMSLVSSCEVDGVVSEGWKVGTWLWADKLTCQAVVSCLRLAIVEALCGMEFLDRDVNLTPGK